MTTKCGRRFATARYQTFSHFLLLYCFKSTALLPSCGAIITNCQLRSKVVHVQWVDNKFVRTSNNEHDGDKSQPTPSQKKGDKRNLRRAKHFSHMHHHRNAATEDDNYTGSVNSTANNITNNTNSDQNSIATSYQARECPCAQSYETTYCIITSTDENLCEVDGDSGTTRCYHGTAYSHVVRNSWPVMILWYAAITVYLLCTESGRGALQYIFAKIFCRGVGHIRDLAGTILESENDDRSRRMELRRRNRTRDNVTYVLKTKKYRSIINSNDDSSTPITAPSTPQSSSSSPTSLDDHDDTDTNSVVLTNALDVPSDNSIASDTDANSTVANSTVANVSSKTMTSMTTCVPCTPSKQNTNIPEGKLQVTTTPDDPYIDSDDDEDRVTCTICFVAIEDGDRIGALQCDHKFHVNCLKEWIKRRNVCPLCQSPNIADVRPSPTDTDDNLSGSDVPIITRLTVVGTSPRTLGRSSPSGRSTVDRVRRLREARREAVRTRLFPDNVIIPRHNRFEGTRVPTSAPSDSFVGDRRISTLTSGGGHVAVGESNGTVHMWETLMGNGDGRSRSIINVSTNRRSGGRRGRRIRQPSNVSTLP